MPKTSATDEDGGAHDQDARSTMEMVLDGDDAAGGTDAFDGEQDDFVEVTEDAVQLAASRRAEFDAVLGRSRAYWDSDQVPDAQVRRALGVLLDHLAPALQQRRETPPDPSTNGYRQPGPPLEHRPHDDPEVDTTTITAPALESKVDVAPQSTSLANVLHRAQFIPLRLSHEERALLRLVDAALGVSDYTDRIDVIHPSSGSKRNTIHTCLRALCALLAGLLVASDFAKGRALLRAPAGEADFSAYSEVFRIAFEVARRHKIANPEKMRATYGKMIHALQDAVNPAVEEALGFKWVAPLRTVKRALEEGGAVALLSDPQIEKATMEVRVEDNQGRTKHRVAIQREIKEKERAVELLAKKYSTGKFPREEIRRALYSIGDNNAYLRCARDPCDTMIRYLENFFFEDDEDEISREKSLAIMSGRNGARLTHNHRRQYQYVMQSLTLWREVNHNMFQLWYLAEQDLLDEQAGYVLRNTGQGLHRLQRAPKVSKAMHNILKQVQKQVGNWIGSSVIHLGDHNVPNALVFIDKYAQVQRILLPLCTAIRRIEDLVEESPHIARYVAGIFGGVGQARMEILRDFFRHAFDGSGADNFFDAGSCIDGRLTSAWNWCSTVEKKRYYHLLLLTGFSGFDGQF